MSASTSTRPADTVVAAPVRGWSVAGFYSALMATGVRSTSSEPPAAIDERPDLVRARLIALAEETKVASIDGR